ncbi:hypothetical protein SO802_022900 [Lithocarpus litseifolius]|uniref:Uncharacterized protein n=1 Tax=Lithocarpus litseifolius TaxID=425828 RepID=A0AAW2C738_9ROSI
MLENPTPTATHTAAAAAAATATATADTAIKRYAPPNQRNRPLNRRKSDRFDRTNNLYANDVDKNQVAGSKNVPVIDLGDSGSSNLLNENPRTGLIALQGCCSSEASQLLNERWTAAMRSYHNPSIDLAERPVMYSGSGSAAWGQPRIPQQIIGAGPSGSQMDFLGELRRAMCNAHASFST